MKCLHFELEVDFLHPLLMDVSIHRRASITKKFSPCCNLYVDPVNCRKDLKNEKTTKYMVHMTLSIYTLECIKKTLQLDHKARVHQNK